MCALEYLTPTSKSSLPTLIPRSVSELCLLSTLHNLLLINVRDGILLRLHGISLSGLVLDVQFLGAFSVCFLIDFSSIVSFFCVSLGPWCFLLRLATLHPSQLARVKIFLQSQRRIQLCGPCLVDHGRLDAFTASFTVPWVSAGWLHSWIRVLRTS